VCGRFTQNYTWDELVALYRLTMPSVNTQPSYNVCPTDPIEVILPMGGRRPRLCARPLGARPLLVVEAVEAAPLEAREQLEGAEGRRIAYRAD
jgi:putative SOS response-associated peptidase YedK